MRNRIAKRGAHKGQSFWGCSRYPNCNGIREAANDSAKEEKIVLVEKPEKKEPEKPKTPLTDKQRAELVRLRDKLLNLSSRNRSIKLSKLYKQWSFDLSRLNEFDNELANNIIHSCLNAEADITILPKQTADNEKVWKRCFDDLNLLSRQVEAIHQEKGLYDLYIGYPFLTGYIEETQTAVQAPIFLMPVRLEKFVPKRGNNNWKLSVNKGEPMLFNKTLFFALSKLGKYKFNANLFDQDVPEDLYGEKSFLEWAHDLLNEYGIVCNKSETADHKVIESLNEFSSREIPESVTKAFTIHPYGVLGHFPQSSSSVQKDYDAMLEMGQEELASILTFLEEGSELDSDNFTNTQSDPLGDQVALMLREDSKTIDDRPESNNSFVLPSDASQDRIVMEVVDNGLQKLVVWGPPGTGKSQTIVNIVSNCVKKGKTVLLVSQKRAALDVVVDRLITKNLGDFALIVHDSLNDRKTIYSKINGLIDQEVVPDKQFDPSDEVQRTTNNLRAICDALNDNSYGISFREIYQKLGSSDKSENIQISPAWEKSTYAQVRRFIPILNELQRCHQSCADGRLLQIRRSYSNLNQSCLSDLERFIAECSNNENAKFAYEIFRWAEGRISYEDFKNMLTGSNSGSGILRIIEEHRNQLGFARYFKNSYWNGRSEFNKLMKESYISSKKFQNDVVASVTSFINPKYSRKIVGSIKKREQSYTEIMSLLKAISSSFLSLCTFDLLSDQHGKEIKAELKVFSENSTNLQGDWGTIFESTVLSAWLRKLEDKHPCIALIRSGQADELRRQYAQLLDRKNEFSAIKLAEALKLTSKNPIARKLMQALKADTNRKRNVKTLRKFNETYIGDAIYRKLVPVWLASPEAVSDIFPLTVGLFDVVVFDEASQCTVETGIPAVLRGKQVVIAGDEKQLPPSHLFELQVDGTDDEESFAAIEPSLLTLAKKTRDFRYKMLEWHYRSKFEELINFSNYAFYDAKIKISPNVSLMSKDRENAIVWHSVNGFWEDRSNRIEADKVIERLKYYLSAEPNTSVGIVTFNINQKKLIEDLIDQNENTDVEFQEFLKQNRALPLDKRYFVKNIENVQGDERDVIIFSVGYAPPRPGERVYQMFGSLSQKGGENRLNVAISRAISKIEIVASIDPEKDLSPSSANAGPRIFRDYLRYAKAIAEGNSLSARDVLNEYNSSTHVRPGGSNQTESPLEDEILEALIELGYSVDCQVGQSGYRIDMAVVNPDDPSKYLLGIECDGCTYHSSISARERDVFRQRFLESRGWKIHRIWSPNWWHNKQTETAKLRSLIESLRSQKRNAA